MKKGIVLLVIFGAGAIFYFYALNSMFQYKAEADAQAYQRTNLLEGIDVQPFEKLK